MLRIEDVSGAHPVQDRIGKSRIEWRPTLARALTAALSSSTWNCSSAVKNLFNEVVKKEVVSSSVADSRYTWRVSSEIEKVLQ